MIKIRMFLAAILLSLFSGLSAYAVKLNESEKQAQKNLIEYLRSKKYTPSIDSNDQSVCFKRNNTLYWIELKGDANMMLYTLHRNGIKFALADDPKASRKAEVAMMAANMINETHVIKAYQKGGTVRFCMSMYASNTDAFNEAFTSQMKDFDKVKEDFDRYYKLCKVKVDSIHSYWYDLDTTSVVIEQKVMAKAHDNRNLEISRIAVRNVDNNDNIISDYDQGIRKSKASFLQEKVMLKADNAGVYKVGVKLYTPDGKLLLPSKDARFTTITTIKVPKANKEAEYDLLKFGSRDPKDWDAGEYKIEFYEDDTCIYTDAINIL